MLPFTPTELLLAVSDGDVTARPHPTLPYTIFNYSPEVQYRKKWNDVTLNCRGLILDDEFNVIARPWKKFFNLGEVNLPIQFTDPVEVMDKADGSLGILYPTPDSYAIATRGSFESEQAKHATRLLHDKYRQDFPNFDDYAHKYTFLFEIVYPENRIVLDYDGMDDLILLGAVENDNGYYLSPIVAAAMLKWNGPVVGTFQFNTITDALGQMGRKNAEGYVIRSHNFMVKVKEPDYVELHRLVTNMTPKTIWEQLKAGKSVAQICADLPDEFHRMAEDIARPLMDKYVARTAQILEGFYSARMEVEMRSWGSEGNYEEPSRKQYAKVFTKRKDSKYYFALLDGRSIADLLWTELKPKEEIKSNEDV